MLRIIGVLALLGLALALGACRSTAAEGSPPPSPDPVLAEMGQDVYVRHCAACHGEGARGDGPAAGELRTPPADLTRIAARRGGTFPKGEIARYIDGRFAVPAHGTREMPVWGQRLGDQIPEAEVSEEVVRGQISVVIEYLESIQQAD